MKAGWRKNATLPQRVEISRRRSRRCLVMSLALAKTSVQQFRPLSFLHIIVLVGSGVLSFLFLAHVGHTVLRYTSYWHWCTMISIRVVPFYDHRTVVSVKDAAWTMFCGKTTRHFKKTFCSQGSGGITIKKTSQALLIGIYDEPVTPGQCNIVVERLGDYLIEQGL
ncbi:hypothetical protein ACFX2G_044327 [Malus domestica]